MNIFWPAKNVFCIWHYHTFIRLQEGLQMNKKVCYLTGNRKVSISDLKKEFKNYEENQRWFMKNKESLSRGLYDTESILLYLERKALSSKLDLVFKGGNNEISVYEDGEIISKKCVKDFCIIERKRESTRSDQGEKNGRRSSWNFLKIMGSIQRSSVMQVEKYLGNDPKEMGVEEGSHKVDDEFEDPVEEPIIKKDAEPAESGLLYVETFENSRNKNESVIYSCPVSWCGKRYRTKNGLEYHIRIGCLPKNDYTRPYKCKYPGCNKRYKNRNGLKYHQVHGHCNKNTAEFL